MATKPLHLADRLMVGADSAARLLGIGRSVFYLLRKENRLPKPVRFNDRDFWRPDELRAWTVAGCPDVEHWMWRPVLLRTVEEALAQEGPRLNRLRQEQRDAEAELTDLYQRIRTAKQRLDEVNRLASATARG